MTKRAVQIQYQQFLDQLADELVTAVKDEFGEGLVGKVVGSGAKPVINHIKSQMTEQGEIVVDYAAAIANDAEDTSRFERRFLETNPVYQRYDGDERAELRAHLLEHFRTVGDDLAPLVASEHDDFWMALRSEYSRSEAKQLVERHFTQAETFIEYREGVFPSERIGSKVIEILRTGERRLRDRIYAELDSTYGEPDDP